MPMPVHRAGNFAMCHRCHKAPPRCRVVRCCLGQPKVGSVTLLLRPCETLAKSPLIWLTSEPSRSEEHTSELQSLMRISYAVFCLKKKTSDEGDREDAQRQYRNAINDLAYPFP